MLNATSSRCRTSWEYPWYAAWDLAFHTTSLALWISISQGTAAPDAADSLRAPQRAIPRLRVDFSDVNPPVHAWATLYLYKLERTLGRADLRFLERSFQGLMLNFTGG